MAGVPGRGGRVPKRSNQKHGHRSKAEKDLVDRAPGAAVVEAPKPNSRWHPIAKRWFASLADSGQSAFYEPSDWETAYLLAESLSRDLSDKVVGVTKDGKVVKAKTPISGASLSSYLKAMAALLVTEGDRRRARLELERPKGGAAGEGAASVSWLAEARRGRESG